MYYYNGYLGCIELMKTKLANKRYLLTGCSKVWFFSQETISLFIGRLVMLTQWFGCQLISCHSMHETKMQSGKPVYSYSSL